MFTQTSVVDYNNNYFAGIGQAKESRGLPNACSQDDTILVRSVAHTVK